jgi:hypothetical protein
MSTRNVAKTIADGNPLGQALVWIGWTKAGHVQEGMPTQRWLQETDRLLPDRYALALAKALGMRPLQAHCHFGLGTLYTKLGRHEQARAELSAAIKLYWSMEMMFWLPKAETLLAHMCG